MTRAATVPHPDDWSPCLRLYRPLYVASSRFRCSCGVSTRIVTLAAARVVDLNPDDRPRSARLLRQAGYSEPEIQARSYRSAYVADPRSLPSKILAALQSVSPHFRRSSDGLCNHCATCGRALGALELFLEPSSKGAVVLRAIPGSPAILEVEALRVSRSVSELQLLGQLVEELGDRPSARLQVR